MSLTCPGLLRRLGAAARVSSWPLVVALLLGGCSNVNFLPVNGSIGVGNGVAISTPGSVTQLILGQSLPVSASVINDVNSAGVTWTMTPSNLGYLSNPNDINAPPTNSEALYVAPAIGAGVAGSATVSITATSIANPANYATITLVVLGTPVMNTTPLFPANVNVLYSASISINGGTPPIAWYLVSPPTSLPPGMVLNGTGGPVTSISGMAAAPGTYTFTVKAIDGYNYSTQGTFTLQVNPQYACLLSGQYVLYFTGFRGGGGAAHTASINIDAASGAITGVQDYKDYNRVTPQETLSAGSVCQNSATNAGVLTLLAPSGGLQYEFAATLPNSAGQIPTARLQLIGSGSDTGSGVMSLQDSTAFSAGTALPAGDFAFGLLGTALHLPYTVRFGTAGRFTTDATGTLSNGTIDSNFNYNTAPLNDAATSGTLSAPDANGRGTLSLATGAQSSSYVYYLVNANKMLLMNIDPTAGTPGAFGFLTRQTGNLTATNGFDNNALTSPSILSLWGAQGFNEPFTVDELGRLSNGNASAGTFDAELDISDLSYQISPEYFTAQSYAIGASGRGTLSLNDSTAPRSFVFYLDGPSNGYILEQGSSSGNAGLLEAQYTPPAAPDGSHPYPSTFSTFYAGGTQFPTALGPVIMMPMVTLSGGSLSSSFTTGVFSMNPADGRGFGTLTDSSLGFAAASLYIVSPDKINLLRFVYRTTDASMEWFTDN